jgi:hypothetical protein
VNYQQDDWADLLPLAEFAYNNTVHAATKQIPFFANYGYHPRFNIQPPVSADVPAAEDQLAKLQAIKDSLAIKIKLAQDHAKEFADKHQSTPPTFKKGDQVWLLRHNIKTIQPSGKLDFK